MVRAIMLHHYYVTGPGEFPDDMLRYDRAKIIKTVRERNREERIHGLYLLEGETRPTEGRWQSFLWSVINTDEKCLRWGLDATPLGDHSEFRR